MKTTHKIAVLIILSGTLTLLFFEVDQKELFAACFLFTSVMSLLMIAGLVEEAIQKIKKI